MKDRIKEAASSFFIIVTLINIAIFILGKLLRPEQTFGYEAFIYPVIYGLITSIPGLLLYTKKEMSIKQALLRNILHMFFIIAILLGLMFGKNLFRAENLPTALFVALSAIVIYIFVDLIRWYLDKRTADQMTSELMSYKERIRKEL